MADIGLNPASVQLSPLGFILIFDTGNKNSNLSVALHIFENNFHVIAKSF
jgi:hypothetical protein